MTPEISKDEAAILYEALLAHDGHSLRPDWDQEKAKRLTDTLDIIRFQIRLCAGEQ